MNANLETMNSEAVTTGEARDDTLCCAQLYEQPWIRLLLGDSFHPGGISLTRRLAQSLSLPAGSKVGDVACGIGATAVLLSRELNWSAVGIDASHANIARARENALKQSAVEVSFQQAVASALPFEDATIDAVFCECAVSTFDDRPRVIKEFHRVLRPGGWAAISDMVVEGSLPAELQGPLARWACVAGAGSSSAYERWFQDEQLTLETRHDESASLVDLLLDLKRKLLVFSVADLHGLGIKVTLTDIHEMLKVSRAAVEQGVIRYQRMVFRKQPVIQKVL